MTELLQAVRLRRRSTPAAPAGAAREIAELAHTRFAQGRGGTVFLSGGPGAGQALVFDELPSVLPMTRRAPLLLRGSIVGDTYVPVARQVEPVPGPLSVAAGLATRFATPLLGPLGPLLGQVIDSVNDVQHLYGDLSTNGREAASSGPRLLQRALRALADARPVCLAVESNPPIATWWLNLIDGLAAEADVDLRLLMVVGVEGDPQLSPGSGGSPEFVRLARNLVDSGRAEWRPMPRLDDAGVEALIGRSAPDVRAGLSGVTDGQAGWVVELFDDWRRRRVVIKDRRRWVFDHTMIDRGIAAAKEIVEDRIRDALGENRESFENARRMLALAALQGETFTLSAIAECLEIPIDICHRLARQLADGENGKPLLGPAAMGTRAGDPASAQYRFTDRFALFSLRRYGLGPAERRDAAATCAESLEHAYASDPAPVANQLEHLYAFAGDMKESDRWRRIAEVAPEVDQLRWEVKAVIEEERRWSRWTREQARRKANFLLDAVIRLSRARPADELRSLLDAAEKIAAMHDLERERLKAIRLQGSLDTASGDYRRARERFDAAGAALGPAADPLERAGLLCDQAWLDGLDDVPRALQRLDEAIGLCQSAPTTQAEARAHDLRGKLELEHVSAVGASDDLATAVRLYRELDDADGLCSSLTTMAAAQIAQNNVRDGVAALCETIEVARDTGNKVRELDAQQYLGVVTLEHQTAYQHHERALILARELNNARAESDALLWLGRRAVALQQWEQAGRLLQDAFERHERLKNAAGVAACLLELGILQTSVGALVQAEKNLHAALELFSAESIRGGLIRTHRALGELAARRGNHQAAVRESAIAAGLTDPPREHSREASDPRGNRAAHRRA